jgi:hypothetical protein
LIHGKCDQRYEREVERLSREVVEAQRQSWRILDQNAEAITLMFEDREIRLETAPPERSTTRT